MKVIFLDIDGVLNVEVFINAFWEVCKQAEIKRPEAKVLRKDIMRDQFGTLFCPTATSRLKAIIDKTGAKIIISSTWRLSGLQFMQDLWKHRNLPGEVIGITPSFRRDRTPEEEEMSHEIRAERGREIEYYLSIHPEIEAYVIIDDDNDMLPSQASNFVRTDECYGITTIESVKAIQILNKND